MNTWITSLLLTAGTLFATPQVFYVDFTAGGTDAGTQANPFFTDGAINAQIQLDAAGGTAHETDGTTYKIKFMTLADHQSIIIPANGGGNLAANTRLRFVGVDDNWNELPDGQYATCEIWEDGNDKRGAVFSVVGLADNIVWEKLRFINPDWVLIYHDAGINLAPSCSGFAVIDCQFTDLAEGIYIPIEADMEHLTVTRCVFWNTEYGIKSETDKDSLIEISGSFFYIPSGGIGCYCLSDSFLASNCVFEGRYHTLDDGAGIYTANSRGTVSNCVFYRLSDPIFSLVRSTFSITNCIFANCQTTFLGIEPIINHSEGNLFTFVQTNSEQVLNGIENIPLGDIGFASPAGHDFRLTGNSKYLKDGAVVLSGPSIRINGIPGQPTITEDMTAKKNRTNPFKRYRNHPFKH